VSTSDIQLQNHTGSEPLHPDRKMCWRPQWPSPVENETWRGRRKGKESTCLDTTLMYGQGSAGVNTSWELESTDGMAMLDLHTRLNQ